MRKLMLKIATVALLALISVTGSLMLQHTKTIAGAESVVAGALVSVSPYSGDTTAASEFDGIAATDQPLDGSASVNASSVDLMAAGVCAALIGCCILGFALLRLRLGGRPRPSWIAVLRRTPPLAFSPAPLASPIPPSLTLLSISRI